MTSHYLPPLNEIINNLPPSDEIVDGKWFNIQIDDIVWHILLVQCPECGLGIRYVITQREIKICGLEGAEEIVEGFVRQQWKRETDCPHLEFGEKT